MPCAASSLATSVTSRAGVRTIRLTSGWSVETRASWFTCRIAAAHALTSSVDIVHMPTLSSTTNCVQKAMKLQPPEWDRAHAPGNLQHDIRGVRVLARRSGRGTPRRRLGRIDGEARLHVLAQLDGVVGEAQQLQVGHRTRVQAGVADGQPVRDDGGAGGLRLQAGDSAGGVHERIGGREQLGHGVGEPVHVHAGLPREGGPEALVQLLVAAGEADDARDRGYPAELAHGALDVAHPPASAGDDHHAARLGEPERAPRL